MAKKVLITGPECTAKTSIAEAFGRVFRWSVRPETARAYLTKNGPGYEVNDLIEIWRQQCELEQTLSETNKVVVCDTSHFVMHVWNEVKFNDQRLSMAQLCETLPLDYELVLLCSPDLPWEADPLREAPDQASRTALFTRYESLIIESGLPYQVISGRHNRLEQGLTALKAHQLMPR